MYLAASSHTFFSAISGSVRRTLYNCKQLIVPVKPGGLFGELLDMPTTTSVVFNSLSHSLPLNSKEDFYQKKKLLQLFIFHFLLLFLKEYIICLIWYYWIPCSSLHPICDQKFHQWKLSQGLTLRHILRLRNAISLEPVVSGYHLRKGNHMLKILIYANEIFQMVYKPYFLWIISFDLILLQYLSNLEQEREPIILKVRNRPTYLAIKFALN